MIRRYFIIDKSKARVEDLFTALEMCIGVDNTQRYSLDMSLLFIKTTQDAIDKMLANNPGYTLEQILELTFTTEYTYEEALSILDGSDWQKEID